MGLFWTLYGALSAGFLAGAAVYLWRWKQPPEVIVEERVETKIIQAAPEITVYKDLASFIFSAPAVDAVEVVRCKDCRNRNHDGTGKPWCDALEVYLSDNEDFFCSYGERRGKYDR